MKYANLIINSPTQSLDRPFLYSFDDGLSLEIGDCVSVNFGQGKKTYEAFVIEVFEENPTFAKGFKQVKEIKEIIGKEFFKKYQIETIKYIKENYLSTYLEALRLFTPKGSLKGIKTKTKQVIKTDKILDEKYLKYFSLYNLIKSFEDTPLTRKEIAERGFSLSSVNTLIKHGFLKVEIENDYRYSMDEFKNYPKPILNEEQNKAIESIVNTEKTVTLLHGVTGSGKTEVFLDLIEKALSKGYDSVILVPEIALTPQMIERFKGRFSKNISIYHSRLSDGERYDEWLRVKNGDVKIAIGARSALFLPFKNLKVVVIDEEHEASYKSETNPKYKTQDVAKFMMDKNLGKVVLASATPSIESYYKAKSFKYNLVTLKNRALNSSLPIIKVVDMRDELAHGNRSIISEELRLKIEDRLNKKEQIILFINRRGFSSFVSCRKCGFVYKCKNCSVSLTYHNDGKLVCHHCGHTEYMKESCPSCSSKLIKKFGTGTQKVEEEIRRIFKNARTIRMDKDTTSSKDSYRRIYESFKNKEADILIGTQMVAKGLDFKDVTLVGILAADLSLNLPDFRAYERTFQLITQVSGRSGRDKKQGEVILQTYDTDSYAVVCAKNQDYVDFYNKEIENRRLFNYPPFKNLLSIVLSFENEKVILESFESISELIKEKIKSYGKISMLGPNPCLINKIKNLYRYQLILKGDIDKDFAIDIKNIVYEEAKKKSLRVSLDINPNVIL